MSDHQLSDSVCRQGKKDNCSENKCPFASEESNQIAAHIGEIVNGFTLLLHNLIISRITPS